MNKKKVDIGTRTDNIPNENHSQVPIQNFAKIYWTYEVPINTKITTNRNRGKLDGTDLAILNLLAENGISSASEIAKKLQRKKIIMSERGIRKRIKSLQKFGIIQGFTVVLNDEASGKLIRRLVLVKFRNIKNFRKRLKDYTDYITESPYCVFAVRLRSGYDWLHFKCFPEKELADLEDDLFRSQFGDIMDEYHNYDAEVIKSNFNSIVDSGSVRKFLQNLEKNNH